jgi:hypothetical protein
MKQSADEKLTILGAKDNVSEKVRAGVRHVLSPLQGLGAFYSNSLPTAYALGYDLAPASRAEFIDASDSGR